MRRRPWIPISSPAPSPHAPPFRPAIPLQKLKDRGLRARTGLAVKVASGVVKAVARAG